MGVWVKWLNPTFDAADIRGLFYVVCLRGLFIYIRGLFNNYL